MAGAAACARRWRSPSFSLCSAELMAVSVASFPSNDLTLAGRVGGGREGARVASVGCRRRRRVGGGRSAGEAVGPRGSAHYTVHAMQWRCSTSAGAERRVRLTFCAAPCGASPRRPPWWSPPLTTAPVPVKCCDRCCSAERGSALVGLFGESARACSAHADHTERVSRGRTDGASN